LGVPAFSLVLAIDTKLPKSADKKIIPLFQGLFDDFKKSLNDLK
jgi:hypothetical protein